MALTIAIAIGQAACIELATFGTTDRESTEDVTAADTDDAPETLDLADLSDVAETPDLSDTSDPDSGWDISSFEILDSQDTDPDTSDADTDTFPTDTEGDTSITDADTTDTTPGPLTSAQLQAVLDAPDGPTSLPVDHAVVTALKPALGAEPAGFFLQAERLGPAIFVAVDPAPHALTPGVVVSLRVTSINTTSSRREALTIADLDVSTSDSELPSGPGTISLADLTQDLADTPDLLTHLDDFENELVRVDATLTSNFWSDGPFVAAAIDTPAIAGDERLLVRLPPTLADALDLDLNCTVTITGPLWRSGPNAFPSAFTAADLDVTACPRPRLVSAFATSPTAVTLRFDRRLAPLPAPLPDLDSLVSVTTSSGPLSIHTATVIGRELHLETAPQSATTYTATATSNLVDLASRGVDQAFNQATFDGFAAPAQLVINEVNPTLRYAVNCDLVELRVTHPGSLDGVRLYNNATLLFAFGPPLLTHVAADDLIIVHLNASGIDCRGTTPSGDPLPAAVSESTAKDEVISSTHYPTAFDVWAPSIATDLSSNSFVLLLEDASGALIDAAVFHRAGQQVAPASLAAAERARLAAHWSDPGAPYDESRFIEHAVSGIDTSYTSPTSPSLRRLSDTDTDTRLDWGVGPSTFGRLNDGQSPR
jgi:hypothetical protein